MCSISALPVSGNSPHPPICVNMLFALLFLVCASKTVLELLLLLALFAIATPDETLDTNTFVVGCPYLNQMM